jgi:hypothetical protein
MVQDQTIAGGRVHMVLYTERLSNICHTVIALHYISLFTPLLYDTPSALV